jgi:hypothetical protein
MRRIEAGSYYSYLTEGCRLCRKGSKLVFFITGECRHSCFYCPISEEKRGKDVVYANEREVNSRDDVLKEMELMSAEGVAITGGEPFLKLDRLIDYLKLFRELGMHTHIYTATIPEKRELIKVLELVDEVRFHPVHLNKVINLEEAIKISKDYVEVGIEIPAIRFEPEIVEIVNRFEIFLNLNELEFSSTNYNELVKRGYSVGEFYGDEGSRKIAEKYAEAVERFHFCTSLFKDKAQFRRRLIRMAMNHPEFYDVTEDGTLICGLIEGDKDYVKKLLGRHGQGYVEVDRGIETSAQFVEKEGENLKAMGLKVSIVERYPTWKRIVVEVLPL